MIPSTANTTWVLAEKGIRLVTALLIGLWIARYLGPEGYGILSFGLAWVALYSAIATLGLPHIVTRDLVSAPQAAPDLLGTALALRLVGGVACVVLSVGIFGLAYGFGGIRLVVVFFAATGTVFHAGDVVEYWFRSRVEWRYVFRARLVALIAATACRVWFVLSGKSVEWFAAVIALESGLLAGLLLLEAHRLPDWAGFSRPSLASARRLLRDSVPLMLSGIAIMIYMKMDQVMIGTILTDTDVGQYAVAVRISLVWTVIPLAVTQSMMPEIVRARDRGGSDYEEKITRLVALLFWGSAAIATMTAVAGPALVRALLGGVYAPAASVLRIHVWTGVGVATGVAIQQWYLVEKRLEIDLYRTIAGAVTNLGLNVVLIPRAGIAGAAVATVVSQFVAAYLSARWFPSAVAPWRILNAGIGYPFRYLLSRGNR